MVWLWWSSLLEVSVDRSVRKLARDRLRSSLKFRNEGAMVAQALQKLANLENVVERKPIRRKINLSDRDVVFFASSDLV